MYLLYYCYLLVSTFCLSDNNNTTVTYRSSLLSKILSAKLQMIMDTYIYAVDWHEQKTVSDWRL